MCGSLPHLVNGIVKVGYDIGSTRRASPYPVLILGTRRYTLRPTSKD